MKLKQYFTKAAEMQVLFAEECSITDMSDREGRYVYCQPRHTLPGLHRVVPIDTVGGKIYVLHDSRTAKEEDVYITDRRLYIRNILKGIFHLAVYEPRHPDIGSHDSSREQPNNNAERP